MRSWPMKCQPGPPEPEPPARKGRLPGSGCPVLARRPRAPALPPRPRRPAPLPDARRERGPGWHLPTRPARYLSRHLSGADLRGAGGSGSPAESPAPPEPPCLWPLPRRPLSRAPRLARAPAGSGSLRDGIRCQRGGQAPPVGGAKPALTSFPPPPPPAGARPSATLRGWERAPRRGLRGRGRRSRGRGSRSRFNLAGSGREGCGWRRGAQLTGLHGSWRRSRGQTDAEAEREGAREGPPRAHGRSREPPPPPLSEPPFLPPRLRATDGAAGGMTGNSWARAAESKYEQRSRAREDGERARRRRGGLPGLGGRQLPPPPPVPPPEPPEADPGREARCQGHPFPTWGPRRRAEHPTHGSHL